MLPARRHCSQSIVVDLVLVNQCCLPGNNGLNSRSGPHGISTNVALLAGGYGYETMLLPCTSKQGKEKTLRIVGFLPEKGWIVLLIVCSNCLSATCYCSQKEITYMLVVVLMSRNCQVYPSDVNCQVQMSQICKLFLSHLSYSKSFNWHVLIISVKNLQVNSQYLQSVSWNVKTASCFPHVRMCEEWFDSMQRSIRIILIDHNFPSVNVYLVSIIAKLSLQIPLAE